MPAAGFLRAPSLAVIPLSRLRRGSQGGPRQRADPGSMYPSLGQWPRRGTWIPALALRARPGRRPSDFFVFLRRWWSKWHACHRRGKIDPGDRGQALAELLAQVARLHLLDGTGRQLAELERPERYADEARHLQAEMAEHIAHLAVLALANGEGEPRVGALLAVEARLDCAVADAVDGHAVAQGVELRLRHASMRAHAVAAQPCGRRQFERPCQPAVIGEQQQALGVEVEAADADQARQVPWQGSEDGGPALRILMRRHQATRLVIEEQPRALARRQRGAVDRDAIPRADVDGGRRDHGAVDRHPAGRDPGFRLAPRRQPGARDHLGDALTRSALPGLALARHGKTRGYLLLHSKDFGAKRAVTSFMDEALLEAHAAAEAGEVPVGCVIVRNNAVIVRTFNRTLADRDPTAHAELLAIRAAAAALGSERLTDCDLYVTLEPCAMCAAAMSFARIRRLYYAAADPKGGAVENGVRFFASPTCHHRPEVYGGIAEGDAAGLLKDFYRARR